MEFSDAVQQSILDFLKSGNRQAALDFIAKTYHASQYDSKKLLETFERQYFPEIAKSKKFDAATCSGCLSAVLKVIAIIVAILGVITLGLGYFFPPLFGDNFNNRRVPVVVTGFSNTYDSAYVNLIYEYRDDQQVNIDTGTIDYDTARFDFGDTTEVSARDLGLGLGADELRAIEERQYWFYFAGTCVMIVAVVFWLASVTFRVKPHTSEQGRYSRK